MHVECAVGLTAATRHSPFWLNCLPQVKHLKFLDPGKVTEFFGGRPLRVAGGPKTQNQTCKCVAQKPVLTCFKGHSTQRVRLRLNSFCTAQRRKL